MRILGAQVLAIQDGTFAFLTRGNVQSVKTLVPDAGFLYRLTETVPDVHITYRRYCDDAKQTLLVKNGAAGARQWADEVLLASEQARRWIHLYEGLNEVKDAHWPLDVAQRYNEWQAYYSQYMQQEGCSVAAYSWSVGQPQGLLLDDNDNVIGPWPADKNAHENEDLFRRGLAKHWSYYQDGLKASAALSLHEYAAPRMWDAATWLCLRYRRVWDVLPADCRKDIYITETGIDTGVLSTGIGLNGWRYYGYTQAEYMQQLEWYRSEVAKDRLNGIAVHGLHVFHAGSLDSKWDSFSVNGCDEIADYLRQQPDSEYIEKKEEQEIMEFWGRFKDMATEMGEKAGVPASPIRYWPDGSVAIQLSDKGVFLWDQEGDTGLFCPASHRRSAISQTEELPSPF